MENCKMKERGGVNHLSLRCASYCILFYLVSSAEENGECFYVMNLSIKLHRLVVGKNL